jgi:SAM-dependent methyltransferase
MNARAGNDIPTTGGKPEAAQSRQHWDTVYTKRPEHELSWFQAEPELSIKLIENAGLALADPVIDVGGGASVLADRLLKKGYRDISVLDISPDSLEKSRRRLGSQAKKVEWIGGDIRQFRPARQYALWHDRALFHFMMREADRRNYVKSLRNSLSTGGQVIIAAFAIGGPHQCSGLEIMQYDAAGLARELGPGFTLAEQLRETHITPSNAKQLFGYYRFRRT